MPEAIELDVLIFGSGAAGLWLLDDLRREGYRTVLLEAHALGGGQTVASQGILHGGLKYTLRGLLTRSAKTIADMPRVWRECLAGQATPDLSDTVVRAEQCFLWHTASLSSRAGMVGARAGLAAAPTKLPRDDWPEALCERAEQVYLLEEQVISPRSFGATLADAHRDVILKVDVDAGVEFEIDDRGEVRFVHVQREEDACRFSPHWVVFAAGQGNESLRVRVGLDSAVMQRRPLHMVLARGALPALSGHCIDAAHTRVTITSDVDVAGRAVWQVGGQIAEVGVDMDPAALVAHTKDELRAVMTIDAIDDLQWATYRIDRAERVTRGGRRPDDAAVLCDGNVFTVWPTKLVLAPRASALVRQALGQPPAGTPALDTTRWCDWPRPDVAQPPWDSDLPWSNAL